MRNLCCILLAAFAVVGVTSQGPACPVSCDCKELAKTGYVACESGTGIPPGLPKRTRELAIRKGEFANVLLKMEVRKLEYPGKLLHLHLTDCGLQGIESGTFSNFTHLTYLDLSYNQLSALSLEMFQGLNSLRELHLLSAGVAHIPSLNLPSLVKLDLEGNSLITISNSTFKNLINLEYLYLADNKLQQISPTAFGSLTQLRHISLFGNELTLPYRQWFTSIHANNGTIKMKSRSSDSISKPAKLNPWKCCQKVQPFVQFIKFNFHDNEKTFLCDWPPHLAGRLMTSLQRDELDGLSCDTVPTAVTPSSTSGDGSDRKWNGSDDGPIGDLPGSISVVAIVEEKETRIPQNFLSQLDNGVVTLVILLFGFLFAFIAVSVYHCKCGNGKSDEKSRLFFPCSHSSCSDVEISQEQQKPPHTPNERSTIPFKQDHPSYGIASHSIDTMRANGMKPRDSNASSVVSGSPGTFDKHGGDLYSQINRTLYLNDTDQSEDEIWDIKTQQKFKA